MTDEKEDPPGPRLHQLEAPNDQAGSPTPGISESEFLALIGETQESRDEVQGGPQQSGHRDKTDTEKPSFQSKIAPFISRPKLEDPVDFQADFKYTKAPAHQSFPFQRKVPGKTVDNQSSAANAAHVHPRGPTLDLNSGPCISNGPLGEPKDKIRTGIENAKALKIEKKGCDVISIPSDPPSGASTPESDQLDKRRPVASPRGQLTGPPFQGSPRFDKKLSPLNPKQQVRTPGSMLEMSKLSKAFSDIKHKAIIQSTRMHHSGNPGYASNSPVNHASPRQSTGVEEIRYTGGRQGQGRQPGDHAHHQRVPTPEAQPAPYESHVSQSRPMKSTRPSTRDRHKEYGIHKRPGSQASNISMPRIPRGRERSYIQRKKTSPTLEESYVLRNGLNQCWNRFFSFEETRNKHWEEKIQDMMEQLAERDAKLADYLAEIGTKDRIISDLKMAKEEQLTLYQEQEAALAEEKKHRQKIQGRLKEYKDRLNDATNEQQTIFKYFQPRYHQLRDQLKNEERGHQLALEQALASADGIRDKIQKSVAEVQILSQQEMNTLKMEIETLRLKLAEREKELDRERDHINDLRRELTESHELNRNAIKSLSMQNQELAEKTDERSNQVQNMAQGLSQQGQTIQSVLKLLEDSKSIAPSNAELVEDLKILHTEALNSIISALGEHAASGREVSSKVAEDLKKGISGIRESCANLSTQIQESHNASEWQQKFGRVQLDHQVLLRETDRLKQKITDMREEAKTRLEQQESLENELTTLRATTKAIDESDKRAESLQKAKQEIQQSLNERERRIRDLEDKIQRANKTLDEQNRLLRDREKQLRDEHEKHVREVVARHENQEESIKQAKNEESSRILAEYKSLEKRLYDAEQDRNRLQRELEQAKRDIVGIHQNKQEQNENQGQILESATRLIDEFSKDFQSLEQAKRDLNAKLEAWSDDHAETSLIKQAVQKLTDGQQEAIENSKQLGELLDVQKKLDDTWQHHKSQFDALEWAVELEKTETLKEEMEDYHDQEKEQDPEVPREMNRRVTIQSPGTNDIDDDIVPISIEDERALRRQASAPKSIIKSGIFKSWERQEEQYHSRTITVAAQETEGASKHRVAKYDAKATPVSRSAYNRPVLGSSAGIEEQVSDFIAGSKGNRSSEVPSSIKKRKIAETGIDQGENSGRWEKLQHTEKRRLKLSRSMSDFFHDSVQEESATEPAQPRRVRGGPIERKPRSFVTYGSASSKGQ